MMKKHIYNLVMPLLATIAAISLTMPFIRVEVLHEQLADGTCNAYYERFSALDVVLDGVEEFIIGGMDRTNLKLLFYMVTALMVLALVQYAGGLLRKGKIMLYTAIPLFAASFSLFYFAMKHNLDIRYGFYWYMASQALIILLARTSKTDKIQTPA